MKDAREPANIALVDLDGTVADWTGRIDRDMHEVLGEHRKTLPVATLEKIEHLIRSKPGWYLNLEPIPLGFHIVETLSAVGFQIMIATKATPKATNAWSEKAAWSMKYFPYAQVTVTQDKTLLYGKILVDDYPKFAEPWLKNRPRGIVIMPDQPWNQGFKHARVKRVRANDDVSELRPFLGEILNR